MGPPTSASSTPSASSAPSTSAGNGSAGPGTTISRPIPAAIRRLPLIDQQGKTVSLDAWPGKTVLLVAFLSLCQDVCPLITGNLVAAEHSLHADHAASKVQIVELMVGRGA